MSPYFTVSPDEWTFSHNSHGRPEIHRPELSPSLSFNISRTEYAAACLIASSMDCGIDIESPANIDDVSLLSESVLSSHEMASLNNLGEDMVKECILVHWTLKESYLKALGIGLSVSLPAISFRIGHDNNAELVSELQIPGRASNWQFTTIKLANEHAMPVTLRGENNPD